MVCTDLRWPWARQRRSPSTTCRAGGHRPYVRVPDELVDALQGRPDQGPILDETLVAAGRSILIGDLVVDTCIEAVRILNKQTVDTAKKMASKPAFNLAAQLLAAKLNIVAGAGACQTAIDTINAAQAFLAFIDFLGVEDGKKLSAAQSAKANNWATILDKYNNNTLC